MASKTILLQSIPKNWYMAWNINTQAAFNICVTLKDDSKTYVDNQCNASQSFMPPLSTGYQQVVGSNMQLQITIASSDTIKTVLQPYSVPSDTGAIIGQGYNLLLEDSNDDDYNDLYASIIAWKASG
ncbi:hypothetical protein GGD81_003412 [Rhodobium orientis]|uniref:Calcium-mediated lectin domain-containing protein n=1 Tax=Rhodobium orientis TaxID=34017 RepID=A0A327JRD5_9HYPH|nr:hypothetical protein [Rhodobium orientis]MBB4304354.1 hypothetical protein [Rhodobium orientis]MBK5948152.1 hypothetical protein [Rhodobium orientis]RAI28847.1 hypothetical protein CH339_05490 [Rhodobium orientis]